MLKINSIILNEIYYIGSLLLALLLPRCSSAGGTQKQAEELVRLKADFHSVQFSERAEFWFKQYI